MNLQDFTLVSGTASLLAGVVAYTLNKVTDRYVNTPRLKILCEDIHQGEPSELLLFGGIRRSSEELSIKVTNNDTFMAKGCRVYLIELEMLDDVEERFYLRSSIPLEWAIPEVGENVGKFDLPKGLTLSLVLIGVYTNLEPKQFNVDYEGNTLDQFTNYDPDYYVHAVNVRMPLKLDSRYPLRHDRTYRIKVVATAENAEPYYLQAEVCFKAVEGLYRLQIKKTIKGYESKIMTTIEAVINLPKLIREKGSSFNK